MLLVAVMAMGCAHTHETTVAEREESLKSTYRLSDEHLARCRTEVEQLDAVQVHYDATKSVAARAELEKCEARVDEAVRAALQLSSAHIGVDEQPPPAPVPPAPPPPPKTKAEIRRDQAAEKKARAELDRQEREAVKAAKLVGRRKQYAISVGAEQLSAEYQENELGADERYDGKWVAVTGTIFDVGKTWLGGAYLRLHGAGFSTVQCFLGDRVQREVGSFHAGQRVAVRGKVTQFSLGIVGISECAVERYWQ